MLECFFEFAQKTNAKSVEKFSLVNAFMNTFLNRVECVMYRKKYLYRTAGSVRKVGY